MGLRIQASIPKGSVIIGRLKGMKNITAAELENAVTEALEESIEILQAYPAETSGNQDSGPPWFTWYGRNEGMYRFGALRPNRHSAHDLASHWKQEVRQSSDGVTGLMSNDAANPGHEPYAGFVHGSQGSEKPQTTFHAGHGWLVAKDVVEERITADAPIVRRLLNSIKNAFNRG